jgi:hypothetical protein
LSNFFVLGLPRSRTAWLANFLTYNDNFCHHEGINGCKTIKDYKEKIANDGDSGTAMMLFDMNNLFPDDPKLIIERDPKYAIDFCYRVYGNYDPKAIIGLRNKLDIVKGLRIHYDDINSKLQDIWEHLIGEGYDKQRAQMLIKLNVQVTDPFDIDIESAKALLNDHAV